MTITVKCELLHIIAPPIVADITHCYPMYEPPISEYTVSTAHETRSEHNALVESR